MPILTIIAGPNGAGKSTHSKELLADFGIEAFDFSQEYYKIWSEFNFDPYIEQGALERAQKLYISRRTAALEKKQNFAFETTFHTKEILASLEMFRSKRYHLELIFICLESPEISIERVKDRVATGGLAVEEAIIRKKFEDGLVMLDSCFRMFDLVSVYVSEKNEVKAAVVLEPPRNKAILVSEMPASLISKLPVLADFIKKNQ